MTIRKLAICTPVYDGRAHVAFYRGLEELRRALAKRRIEGAFLDAGSAANLPRLRNFLSARALHWGADAILWVDSDIAGTGEALARLIDSEAEIVAIAPQRRPNRYGEAPAGAARQLPSKTPDAEGFLEVEAVATAFCLTRREVFERLAERGVALPLITKELPGNPWYRNFFWYELVARDGGYVDDGEDYYFCRKARQVGFSCYLDTTGRLVHHEGRMELTASFWDLHGEQFLPRAPAGGETATDDAAKG